MSLFAGIDVGTSGCRCLVVDGSGRRAGYGERRWSYTRRDAAHVSLDPAVALEAVAGAVRDAGAERVAAAGVTSQRTGVVLIGDDGAALAVLPNADGRAVGEGLRIEQEHGEAIYAATGRLPAMLYLPARYAWFRANEPEVAAATRHVVSLGDWIVHAFTGAIATDPTHAAESGLWNITTGDYDEGLAAALEVPRTLLAPVLAAGTPAGEVRDDALGLAPGTPVVPAGGDTQAALLGLGVIEPGDAAVVAGTTMLCEQVRADAALDPRGRFWTSPHPAGGFVQEAHCGESGSAVEWWAGVMGTDAAGLGALAERGVAGAGGAVFVDPWPSAAADFTLIRRGGLTFPAPVLALGRPREDVARAVFEGIAFAAHWGLEQLHGGAPSRLAAAGGLTASAVFVAALAGACATTVRVPAENASSALGAAICAAAAGAGGVRAAAAAMADAGREVAPEQGHGYPAHAAVWREQAEGFVSRAITRKGFSV